MGGRCRQSTLEMSSPSRRSAACIIVTSGSRPEPVLPVWPTPSLKVSTAHVRPDPAPHPALKRLEAERRGFHGDLNYGVAMTADLIRRIGEYSAVDRAVCDNGEGQYRGPTYRTRLSHGTIRPMHTGPKTPQRVANSAPPKT